MQVNNLLTKFAPELFNGIEPRGTGGQLLQLSLHAAMLVERLVAHHEVDLLGLGVGLIQLLQKGTNLSAPLDVK